MRRLKVRQIMAGKYSFQRRVILHILWLCSRNAIKRLWDALDRLLILHLSQGDRLRDSQCGTARSAWAIFHSPRKGYQLRPLHMDK